MPINANKPHLWKKDVAASVDLYNNWFMRFAPKTYRDTRQQTTEQVHEALKLTTRHRNPWYKQESRPAAPILCTYMSRGKFGRAMFRFFRNYSQATAANVYLLLYPKPEVQAVYDQDPKLLDALFILLKRAREEYLLHEGRTYGGGLNKIEPKELARVRLPDDPVLHTLNLKPKQLVLFER